MLGTRTSLFFFIFLLLQTGVIIFTATYFVLHGDNTGNGESVVWENGRHRRYDLKSGSRGKEPFSIVVGANGIIIDNEVKKLNELTPPNQRKPILMFIAIMSAPERIHRRNALRRSWLRQCPQHNTSCYIFTDALDMYGKRLRDEIYVPLKQEQFLHKDLILAKSPGGINFATRYLWIIKWANRNYKFDFLLRVDDDYFICMDRLFLELPYRKIVRKLYWGYVHCDPPGGIRVDEGFVIVSNDLIQHFIKEEYKSLMCHPYGDQAMIMWINDIENVTYFGDRRVKYNANKSAVILKKHPDVCAHYLALHGSYPVQIEQYWQRTLVTPRNLAYHVPKIRYTENIMLFRILLLAGFIAVAVDAIDCPWGWESIAGRCYYFSAKTASWRDARDDCLRRGGDLAVPTNSLNDGQIFRAIKKRNIAGSVWIGISRDWENKFHTVCGMKPTFTNWRQGEPNDAGGNENCAEIIMQWNGQWNDLSCHDARAYVCQLSYPRCKY